MKFKILSQSGEIIPLNTLFTTCLNIKEGGTGETDVDEDGANVYKLLPGHTYILHASFLFSFGGIFG